MNFKEFMDMYDNWNGITKVNDYKSNMICIGKTLMIMEEYKELWNKKVIAFGFYDNEFCVRIANKPNLYINKETGEVLTYKKMIEQGNELYNLGDDITSKCFGDYYEKI